jgi:PKD repeat protein
MLVGLLLIKAPAALAASPTVSVSPTAGDPGTGLTVNGSGWTPTAQVTVEIGGATVCQLTADPITGNISGTQSDGCQVPTGLTPGSQPLTAQDLTDGTATGAPFTVTPFASFTAPSSVAYGTAVNLDASQSQGTITHYLWDFGDGSSGSTTAAPSAAIS